MQAIRDTHEATAGATVIILEIAIVIASKVLKNHGKQTHLEAVLSSAFMVHP